MAIAGMGALKRERQKRRTKDRSLIKELLKAEDLFQSVAELSASQYNCAQRTSFKVTGFPNTLHQQVPDGL